MYVLSYCLALYFHKSYAFNEITIVRSLNDSLEELADLSTILLDILEYRDNVTTSQLLECAKNVVSKKSYHSLAEMFCFQLKFVVDICKKFCNKKFSERLELSLEAKKKFGKEIPLILITIVVYATSN